MKQHLAKEETGFAQVKNEVLSNPDLSLKAKGLFALLYSKPDNWDFSGERLSKETKDGEKAIWSGLRELEEHGYLSRQRTPEGKMVYTIFWNPNRQKGSLGEEPNRQNGKQPKRQTAERGSISNKEYITNKEEKETLRAEPSSAGEKPSFSQLGAEIIREFENLNPVARQWYKNTTQRAAADRLIEEHGMETVRKVIALLPQTNRRPYMPTITSPRQLEEKWVHLRNRLEQEKAKTITKQSNVI